MQQKKPLYIGLMSGTSLDGVDGMLVQIDSAHKLCVLNHAHLPMPAELRRVMLELNTATNNELHQAALAANQLVTELYAPVVEKLIAQSAISYKQVIAIGAHGQTVRHQPQLHDGIGYTCQLNAPALLAEYTGITVVTDFRSRDIAAGGQGAPLVPAFHANMFAKNENTIRVLNLGGIANLTVLNANVHVSGFDCGPANVLMDSWIEQHNKKALFDAGGAWAASGKVQPALLDAMLQGPYFKLNPPKSTGRDLFNMAWLQKRLEAVTASQGQWAARDIQATLLELIVQTCASAVKSAMPNAAELIVCGGGALNTYLMQRLQALLGQTKVEKSDAYGLPALQVEATAFAWLARQCIHQESANLPQVTGARGPRILGAIYPA